ncbi:Zn-dependent hydrolase [Paraphaeosphaeria sporulosa]|uniref:Zn-dependent hydrolase n=1 Tax=Paraphaeosphaeria sporulosa TaxID=1460663 RepID=A0A177CEY2_9PLEO|nr:Zn-dependent hydrolase [Paraphaeosphaeria sporulosa]OAG05379.1 Zn-dependent hydrolase [Paraphaeosphaeria sporulosa]
MAADTSTVVPSTLRTFCPDGTTGVYAYYDGRTCPWHASNYYDETLALGVATYSIISGNSAVLFDAGLTPAHAAHMLAHVRSLGATDISTVYSHFHSDHIAGASALRETKIIAHKGTYERLVKDEQKLRYPGEDEGPSIEVVLPMETYEKSLSFQVGDIKIELHNFHIHTTDSTLLFLPESGLVIAGDMLEDTVTYISEPKSLHQHLRELERMAQWPIKKILPAHGSPDRIKAGGFDKSLIYATIRYLKAMNEPIEEPDAWTKKLDKVVKDDLVAGRLVYCEAYEGVHLENVESMKENRAESVGNLTLKS